jgi:ribose transport system substrate-binding protein
LADCGETGPNDGTEASKFGDGPSPIRYDILVYRSQFWPFFAGPRLTQRCVVNKQKNHKGGVSMNRSSLVRRALTAAGAISLLCSVSTAALAAGPEIVSGPAADPTCYVPWTAQTKFFKYPAKPGPYRIALANGFIANTWRIQMIKTAKAYAAQPDVAAKIKEFKVVSTGEDVAAQIAAINNFIDSGFDAIIVNAQNPKAFGPVIKRAKAAGVILVAFDNILDTEDAIDVDVDQKGLGVLWANWLIKHIPNGGKILEVRGVAGTSVDTDRHSGIHETLDASGKKWDVVEVVGKWDDPTAQKATADAIAVQKHFDGITAQGGDTGVVQAMIDAGHPFVPFGGETENGFRKFCGAHSKDGLVCSSAGTGPAQVAVAMKTAIDALQGKVVPQSVKLPLAIVEDPDFKDGTNYYSNQSDNFFVGNSFPTCGINFTAQEIMGQTQSNQ